MGKQVSDCCGAEVSFPPEDQDLGDAGSPWLLLVQHHYCMRCVEKCSPISKEEWLHQKIDSLQGELREVKAKLATLEGEISTMQKFIRSQQQTPPGRNPETKIK